MKSKLSLALLTTLAFAPLASADTEFRITGSTAFRSAVHAGLLNSFFTAAPKYGHSNAGGAISTASKSIWQGSVTGIAGTTTVRCTWSGSATGIQSVTAGSNVSFLTTAAIPASPGENPGQSASENLAAHAAFSDVGQTSTSFLTPPLDDTPVGVVVFSWVVNDTSATGASVLARYGFDNVTAQAARALYTTGQQPKALFTGNPLDEAKPVFATGRDTGSGTRITMLAETKYGIFTPLSNTFSFSREPCTRFFNKARCHAKVNNLTYVGNAFTIHDVKLRLTEWRRHFVFDNLYACLVTHNGFTILDRAYTTNVQPYGGVKL